MTDSKITYPKYYGGHDNPYEAIKIIEALDLNFHLGNVFKYIIRAGKKNNNQEIDDLNKALWYLERHIKSLGLP